MADDEILDSLSSHDASGMMVLPKTPLIRENEMESGALRKKASTWGFDPERKTPVSLS
jgi:hypothetical protein